MALTQKELVEDIHIRVVKMEEHLKEQNNKVNKNCAKLEILVPKVQELTHWDKIKTVMLMILSGMCGSMATFILTKIGGG